MSGSALGAPSPSFHEPAAEQSREARERAGMRSRRHLRAVPAPEHEDEVPGPEERAVQRLALAAFEAMEGYRAIAQLGATITPDVADELFERRSARTQLRSMYHDHRRIVAIPGRVHSYRAGPLAIEASVTLTAETKSIAVAMRLEFLRGRWRATHLTVL